MAKPQDDFEVVRTIVSALEGFPATDQERILRWAREKLGLAQAAAASTEAATSPPPASAHPSAPPHHGKPSDIKAFVAQKNPRSDNHFAITVAYFHRFEAPSDRKKDSITGDDLQEAARLVGRKRLHDPGHTLRDAHRAGLLDKGDSRGTYSINTVGENLVAMTLPSAAPLAPAKATRRTTSKRSSKKGQKPR